MQGPLQGPTGVSEMSPGTGAAGVSRVGGVAVAGEAWQPNVMGALAWRVGLVVLALITAVAATLYKSGSVAGTLEANMGARAAAVGTHPAEWVAAMCPELERTGTDLAEVRDKRDVVLYRSPSLLDRELPASLRKQKQLFSADLPLGADGVIHRGYGMTVRVTTPAGEERTSTYVTTRSPFAADSTQSVVLLAVFLVLPTVLFAVLMPSEFFRPK